jgi:voltage-gated potassium channel
MSLQSRLHEIIFEADTPVGKAFDICLILAILLSVATVLFESVASINQEYGQILYYIEWGLTLLFTIEYIARIKAVGRPRAYIFSFFGIVDLIAIIPTYLSIFISGVQMLLVIRILRLLRVFRVFKLARYISESQTLIRALKGSKNKIVIFLITIFNLVVIIGTIMYLVEGPLHGFTSIPKSIYWAIVTMTTVGYGDISPQTPIGQLLASMVMIIGYAIIAVPTGILTVELSRTHEDKVSTQSCPSCATEGHPYNATYCFRCGKPL